MINKANTMSFVRLFLALLIFTDAVYSNKHDVKTKDQVIKKHGLRNGNHGDFNCFSGLNTVEVHNKGSVAMKDLQVGDLVKGANGKMVRVFGFGPYEPTIKAEFLQIHAQGIKRPLEISKGHMVFVNGNATPASAVQVGDELDMASADGLDMMSAAKVEKIVKVVRTGIYTPFTESGTIMVNGIAASSYVTLQEDSNVMALGNKYATPLSMQQAAHMFHAIPRMACLAQAPYYCAEEGLDKWVARSLFVGAWFKQQHWMVSAAVFVLMLWLGLIAIFVEMAFTGNMMVTLIVIIAAAFLAVHVKRGIAAKTNKKKVD